MSDEISQRPSPIKIWLLAARPRTLPAGVAPVLVGTALAAAERSSLRVGAFLAALAYTIGPKFGVDVPTVTGGNSASLHWALGGSAVAGINDLRLGESILLGVDPLTREPIPGLRTDDHEANH